jgi:hypothetical protein
MKFEGDFWQILYTWVIAVVKIKQKRLFFIFVLFVAILLKCFSCENEDETHLVECDLGRCRESVFWKPSRRSRPSRNQKCVPPPRLGSLACSTEIINQKYRSFVLSEKHQVKHLSFLSKL